MKTSCVLLSFIYVSEDRARYYNSQFLFGERVASSFPSAGFDIEEAGKCFALGRSTACAFHLFRVVEIGLKALALKLSVPLNVPSWDGILKKIDMELKKEYKDKAPEWKLDEVFFADAALHLRNYKHSRNSTQHADKKYTIEEAQRIFNAVHSLMQHLATKLSEIK